MTQARFSIIRCVPDLARGECFNVGIVLSIDRQNWVAVDDAAARRAVVANPKLARDSLRSLGEVIKSRLTRLESVTDDALSRLVRDQPGFPYSLAEPTFVRVAGLEEAVIRAAIQRLMDRLVALPDIPDDTAERVIEFPLDQRLGPLIDVGRIAKDYPVERSRTRVPRVIDYFVNSRANVALDVISVDRASEDTLVKRIDAQAYKMLDIRSTSILTDYYVYCYTAKGPDYVFRPSRNLLSVIGDAGGRVVTTVEEAATALEHAARDSLR